MKRTTGFFRSAEIVDIFEVTKVVTSSREGPSVRVPSVKNKIAELQLIRRSLDIDFSITSNACRMDDIVSGED